MSLVHTVLQWGMMGMLAKGSAMILPLLAASVTSLTVIIERGSSGIVYGSTKWTLLSCNTS
jgi:hypothetical protein